VITYKRNRLGTLQASHCGEVRVGYIDCSDEYRWIWSLNMIQPGGGRATGIVESEGEAKQAMEAALRKWVDAAGLTFKGQQDGNERSSGGAIAGAPGDDERHQDEDRVGV
jgi:hypothetical protein